MNILLQCFNSWVQKFAITDNTPWFSAKVARQQMTAPDAFVRLRVLGRMVEKLSNHSTLTGFFHEYLQDSREICAWWADCARVRGYSGHCDISIEYPLIPDVEKLPVDEIVVPHLVWWLFHDIDLEFDDQAEELVNLQTYLWVQLTEQNETSWLEKMFEKESKNNNL